MAVTSNPDVWAVSVENLPHDPALARVGNFLASGPKQGIVPAGPASSGAVRPMSTPSNKGRVLPFVGVAPNPASGHFGETYVFRSRTTKEFTLRAASSGGSRTDAIISRIWDPGVFGVQPPGDDLLAVQVIEGVDAGIESSDALAAAEGIDYPFVWHGNVTLPASENVVTAARITDRRYQIGGEVSHAEHVRVGDIGTGFLTSRDRTNGQIFPRAGGQHNLFIPEWAGRMKVTFQWLDMEYLGERNTYGERWVRVGEDEFLETHHYHFDGPHGSQRQTANWIVTDVLNIPEDMRGTTQLFTARACLGSTPAADDQVRTRTGSATILEVEFRETLN